MRLSVWRNGTTLTTNSLFRIDRKRIWRDLALVAGAFLGVHAAFAGAILFLPEHSQLAGWVSFTVMIPLILTPVSFGIVPGVLAGLLLLVTIPLLQESLGHPSDLPARIAPMLTLLTLTLPVVAGLIAGSTRTLRHALEHERMVQREAHHRIKNSLNFVSSFLFLAERESTQQNSTDVLKKAAGHVAGISAVHDSLSMSNSFDVIEVGEHLKRLGKNLESAGYSAGLIRVNGPPVTSSGDVAVALGLVLNELIANARKHGRPGAETANVTIVPSATEGRLQLEVVQPRASLPRSFSFDESTGIGLSIIQAVLAQHNGSITIEGREPARYAIHIAVQATQASITPQTPN